MRTAVRTLWKHRGFTSINIAGLAVGLAVALLVLLFVRQQWRIDRFHPASERIHRVITFHEGTRYATAPAPLSSALRESGVERVVAMTKDDRSFVARGDSSLDVRTLQTSSAFWQVFDGFRFRAGTKETALTRPHTAVLSLETAQTLFGTDDPVGQTFRHEGDTEYTVTGVLAPPPGPTHVGADVYLSTAGHTFDSADPDAWRSIYGQWTYVRLAENASPSMLKATVSTLFERHARPKDVPDYQLAVQSLSEMRFGTPHRNEVSYRLNLSGGLFGLLGALAVVVLLAAGFNYVNLSVARSLRRMQEVGVRKALGARRTHLVGQFLGEAVLTALLASAVATILLSGLVPLFNDLYILDLLRIPELNLDALQNPTMVGLIVGVGLVVGLLSGAYPAFVLSSYRPVQVLGNQGDLAPGRSSWLSSVLITVQVAVTLILIVTATTALRQVRHMATADYQLRTERLASVALQDVSFDRFREVAQEVPSVEEVSAVSTLMLGPSNYHSYRLRTDRVPTPLRTIVFSVDTSFVRHMGLTFRSKRSGWSRAVANDGAVLLNRAAAEMLGYDRAEEALGAAVTLGDPPTETRTVAGVVDNFEYTGMGEVFGGGYADADGPVMLYSNPSMYRHALVRSRTDDLAALRSTLEQTWTERLDTAHPFDLRFYDDVLRMRYSLLSDIGYMIGSVALLAILIAALGLLSLAAYSVRARTKEIGVRKALGASVTDVVVHLSRPYAGLVAGAALVAAPVAWVLNRGWLQRIEDAVEVGPGIVVLCVIGLVGVGLLTVATQTLRAARIDPATTLRDE